MEEHLARSANKTGCRFMKRPWCGLCIAVVAAGCQSSPKAERPGLPFQTARPPSLQLAGHPSAIQSATPGVMQVNRQPGVSSDRTPSPPQAGPSQWTSRRTGVGDSLQSSAQSDTARFNKVSLVTRLEGADSTPPKETLLLPPPSEAPPQPATPASSDASGKSPMARGGNALTLGDALETGLAQNPALVALRGTANVSAAMARVARVYPWNPFVQAQYFPNGTPFVPSSAPGGGAGMSNYYIWVMQRIELGHQTRHRADSAAAALGQVRWNIRQAELLNVATTERLFFTAIYQRQLRDAAADAAFLNERLLGIVERRYKAGLAMAAERTNARVAARQSRRQANLAEAAYQAALLGLRQQLAIDLDAPLEVKGDLKEFEWFPVDQAIASLYQSGAGPVRKMAANVIESRPDVMAARAGISVARANLSLARAARIQDIQAGPIYDTGDDGTKYLGFRLQRDFGIFNNGAALAQQRAVELGQQNLTYEQLKRQAAIEAHAAIDRYERARRFAAEAAAELSSGPPAELEEMADQYEAGQADILNLLAIQNNLLQDERAYLDLLNELAQSAATVTLATGLPPESFVSPRHIGANP